MKFEIGDKVRVKPLIGDELPRGWVDEMLDYIGKEGRVIGLDEGDELDIDVEFEFDTQSWWYNNSQLESLEKLVDLNQATIVLANGECDAIRFYENVSICAYKDTDGVFKVAKYRGEGVPLKYTDELFFMHEDYLINSKWELIVDKVKRKEVIKHKANLISSAEVLYLLGKLDYDTYVSILNMAEAIK